MNNKNNINIKQLMQGYHIDPKELEPLEKFLKQQLREVQQRKKHFNL